MAWFWSWVLVLGAVTMVGGVLASRMRRGLGAPLPAARAPRVALGLLLAAIAFALCLPSRFPFATGLELGYGLLLGAAAAVLAIVAVRVARPSEEYSSRVATAAAAGGAAILWAAVTEIVFRGDPGYALLGGMAGGALALLPVAWERESLEVKGFAAALLIAGLGSLLAIARYQSALERPLWPLPTMPLASGLLGLVLGGLLFGRARSARWATPALAIILEAVACLSTRALLLVGQEHITVPPQFSSLLVLAWLAFILIAVASRLDGSGPFARLAPALLAVTALVIAFNIAGGYGAAVVLAAGLPLALALWRQDGGAPFWAIAVGILYLAYRLYLAHYEDSFRFGQTLDFGRHYVFIGLAAGLLWVGSARLARRTTGALVAQLAGLALLPPVLFIVFGHEAALGLILGLWVGQFMLPLWTAGEWEWPALPSFCLPLATVWSLIIPNWAEFMLDQPRSVRGIIVGAAAAAVLLVLGLMRQRSAPPLAQSASPEEG